MQTNIIADGMHVKYNIYIEEAVNIVMCTVNTIKSPSHFLFNPLFVFRDMSTHYFIGINLQLKIILFNSK